MADDSSFSGDLSSDVRDIKACIEQMNRRDRLRTVGGFFKNMIALIPIILFLYGAWYLSQKWDEIVTDIAAASAKQAASLTTDQFDSLFRGRSEADGMVEAQ